MNETLVNYEISPLRFAVVWLPASADPEADAKLALWRPGFEAEHKINIENNEYDKYNKITTTQSSNII